MRSLSLVFVLLSTASPLVAAPRVAVDIAPVHSIATSVMEGAGTPDLILPPDASPHHHAMRPSEARALSRAELVITVGPALVPWMTDAAARLAPGAAVLALGPLPGEEDGHDGHDDHEGEHGHDDHEAHHDDDHDDHGHDDHGHDDHDEDHGHEDAHDHGGVDPHAWLDPREAADWGRRIAEALAAADPDQAALYRANAAALAEDLAALEAELAAQLAPVQGRPYVAYHDAYGWFERRFGLSPLGAAAQSDAARPGPARVAALRDALAAADAPCVFVEPQQPERLLRALTEGTEAKTGRLDPLGADIPTGKGQYPALLRAIADGLTACLAR
ncbi:zinc ABC transporter substrate-binding protein [Rhodovulum sp. DZ06]|uniref:zinc ABC transporter substrate-binding protein n=1 Tax=Rhodovulum sp. DZ06 TaxID=3425126 RepID=UPI003D329DB6